MNLIEFAERHGNICVKCKGIYKRDAAYVKFFSVDHIHEKADGGSNRRDNKQLLCWDCHRIKSRMSMLKRSELGRQISSEESLELNEKFLLGRFMFAREVINKRIVKRVILGV